MSNPEHLAILQDAVRRGDIAAWNEWIARQRATHDRFSPDLTAAPLRGMMLEGADFRSTSLRRADLRDAHLSDANLADAYLRKTFLGAAVLERANLQNARMDKIHLFRANLRDANLEGASITEADFNRAELQGANFAEVTANATHFDAVDLSGVRGLERVRHNGPSTVGIDTLFISKGNIPEIFLRGCGVPDTMLTFAKSLVGSAIEYYSAFISYSSADELFAARLHNDLQANGVRVWFATQDLKTGDPLIQTVDEAVRLYDKLVIVLSEDSVHSAWVRHEFGKALVKERQHGKLVLFPIRLDDAVFNTTEQWAYDLRERRIGDFTGWQNPLAYQAAINRLLRDLNAPAKT